MNACKERGLTGLLINQMSGSEFDEDRSGLGLTSLVDTLIERRSESTDDELQRSLVIRKAGGCRHSPRQRELHLTDQGIVFAARRSSAERSPP